MNKPLPDLSLAIPASQNNDPILGREVFVPCNCVDGLDECAESLLKGEIVEVIGEECKVQLRRSGSIINIENGKLILEASILIICLGDIESEALNLDKLSKSILQYCRLFHDDDSQVRYYKTRTKEGLLDLWEEFGKTSKVIIFIGHGCPEGYIFGRKHKRQFSSQELIDLISSIDGNEKKIIISLSCQTGNVDFGTEVSKSKHCEAFIGPESLIHSAVASQFCQTFLLHYFMNGESIGDAYRKAKEAVPVKFVGDFNLFKDGSQHIVNNQSSFNQIQIEKHCSNCGCFGIYMEPSVESGDLIKCSNCNEFFCFNCIRGQKICQGCESQLYSNLSIEASLSTEKP